MADNAAEKTVKVSVRDVFFILFYKLHVFVLTFVIIAGLVIAYAWTATPTYEAFGSVLLRPLHDSRELLHNEQILGAVRKPGFGPLVMCGLGGVAVEVFSDVAFGLAPLSSADAEEMLDALRGVRLLAPFRGRPAGDRGAAVRALRAIATLVEAHPEIAELDVNPLLVLDEGRGCVAVDARIRLDGDDR